MAATAAAGVSYHHPSSTVHACSVARTTRRARPNVNGITSNQTRPAFRLPYVSFTRRTPDGCDRCRVGTIPGAATPRRPSRRNRDSDTSRSLATRVARDVPRSSRGTSVRRRNTVRTVTAIRDRRRSRRSSGIPRCDRVDSRDTSCRRSRFPRPRFVRRRDDHVPDDPVVRGQIPAFVRDRRRDDVGWQS